MSSSTPSEPLTRLAACLLLSGLATWAGAQPPQQKDTSKKPADRIERRTYEFKEAGKEMEYALFVPSGYDKAKKYALIVALHGLGINPQQIIRSRGLVEQAEKYGYIVVAPMGYNTSGWARFWPAGLVLGPGRGPQPRSPRLRHGLGLRSCRRPCRKA